MGCFAIFGLLPLVLSIAALVDIVRTRAEWYWFLIVFFFPFIGPIVYFAVAYGPWNVAKVSPVAARRRQARQRLAVLAVQLSHWRGPAVLAEAGEHWMALGKLDLAESHFREALAAGAEARQVHLPLAEILMVRGRRYREAADLLRPLYEQEPDFRFGAARLALARCLDELGEAAEAERVLRELLVKRSPPEARVRLARLALRRGDTREAQELVAAVLAEGAYLLPEAKRQARVWLRAAKKLRSPDQPLPPPTLETSSTSRSLWVVGGSLVAAVLALPWVFPWLLASFMANPLMAAYERQASLRNELAALEGTLPAIDFDTADPDPATTTYLALREELDPELALVAATRLRSGQIEGLGWGLLSAQRRALDAENTLLEKLIPTLRRHQVRPSQALELIGRLEWACLQRESAFVTVLPTHFRTDWLLAEQRLEQLEAGDFPERERQVAETQAKIADLRAMAPADWPPAWKASCERRRAELERWEESHLGYLLRALSAELFQPAADEL